MTQEHHGISAQARAFLDANLPVAEQPPPTKDNITDIRAQTLAGYQAGIDYAVTHFAGRLEQRRIGGVDCLVVHPPVPNPDRGDLRALYFYGGGFIQGSPEEDLPISASISRTLGIEVICPRYRLSPEHPWPAAHEDGMAVYRAILEHTTPDNLAVIGESAGGNLALSTLLNAHREQMPLPAACVLMSPWIDLTSSGDSLTANDGRDPTLTLDYVDHGARLYAGDQPLDDPAISPLFAKLPACFPPTRVTSGTRDLLLSQAVAATRRLKAAGVDAELRIFEHMWHVFEFYPEIPEAAESLQETCEFLAAVLDNNAR